MSAQETVLGTFELVDSILAHLDWPIALKVQQVCHLWQNVVSSNRHLACMLGFDKTRQTQHLILRTNALNVLTGAKPIHQQEISKARSSGSQIVLTGQATPVFAQMTTSSTNRTCFDDFGSEFILRWHSIPSAFFIDNDQSSWRRMYITQPPATEINIWTVVDYRDSLMYRRMTGYRPVTRLCNDNGITLGQIIDIVKCWKAEAPSSVDWMNERFAIVTIGILADLQLARELSTRG